MLGDAIHNMRSSLDTLAFELAQRHVGRGLTEDEQKMCSFPIYLHRKDLDDFFTDRAGHIWGGLDPAQAKSVLGPRADDVQHDTLWTLNRLWNIDKHRRLHFTVWWPDMISWTSKLGDAHVWTPGHPPWVDGAILGTITAIKTSWPVQADITATVQLASSRTG